MHNNDVLRRVSYALTLNYDRMAEIWGLAGHGVTADQVRLWMKKEDDEDAVLCSDEALGQFLDGLIVERRGPREPGAPVPVAEPELTNNAIFKKLRIALSLKEQEVLGLLESGGQTLSKHELTALFRKPGHKHYRVCGDQVLRAFIAGLTQQLRPST